jgi:hypothetical protein
MYNQNTMEARQMARNARSRAMFNLHKGNIHAAIESMCDYHDARIAEAQAIKQQFQEGVKHTWNSSPVMVPVSTAD